MTTPVIVRRGDSLRFCFDRGGASVDGWSCLAEVLRFPHDSAVVSKYVLAVGNSFPGILTESETEGLAEGGIYRLVGTLSKATSGESEQIPLRFHLADGWGG